MTTYLHNLLKAAVRGDYEAAYKAGLYYLERGNPVFAQAQFRRAAVGGYAVAQRSLGVLGLAGELLDPSSTVDNKIYCERSAQNGITWLKTAASNHDAVAAYLYAKCMQLGLFLKKDVELANEMLLGLSSRITAEQIVSAMMMLDIVLEEKKIEETLPLDICVIKKLAS